MEARRLFDKYGILWKLWTGKRKKNSAASITENDLTPLKVFEVLFGINFERIRKENEHYAQRRGNSDFSLSLAEVKCAVGILILSSYHRLPSRKNHWEQQPEMLT